MKHLTRRSFLAASACLPAVAALPRMARAEAPLTLRATTRTLDINGRAATVFGLQNATGGQGLVLDPGQSFRVDLQNDLDIDTIIHWHGQIPPNRQDGVPGMPMPLLASGELRSYDFAPTTGTHWMHSHVPVQEMQLLAAPLIVRSAADEAADRQDVVMFLHDFSFAPVKEVLAQITGGASHSMAGMDHGSMAGMNHEDMGGMMGGMAMDLNDHDFDAYLANDRTLNDPDVVQVEPGGRIRVRVINAAAATVFWIDTGLVAGRLVAVDGQDIQPVPATRFGIAMGQRLDIELDLPSGGGSYPILALREGAEERTGIMLATPGATVNKMSSIADEAAPAFDSDLGQEVSLRAAVPLTDRPATKARTLMLGGTMMPYLWTIDGRTWGNHQPVEAISGERVEITFHNMSMMGHPMHLHGHHFQVVALNGTLVKGAMRDTVYVPPMSMVTVALDAGEAAQWMLHCHHMPHLSTGMMTEFVVSV